MAGSLDAEACDRITKAIYLKYATIGGRHASLTDYALDGSKFLKIMRESKLIGGALDAPKVDVIFMRIACAGKRITYRQFTEALAAVAEVKGITEQQVVLKLSQADPAACTTKADFVKFHDDKALYTGMYR